MVMVVVMVMVMVMVVVVVVVMVMMMVVVMVMIGVVVITMHHLQASITAAETAAPLEKPQLPSTTNAFSSCSCATSLPVCDV